MDYDISLCRFLGLLAALFLMLGSYWPPHRGSCYGLQSERVHRAEAWHFLYGHTMPREYVGNLPAASLV